MSVLAPHRKQQVPDLQLADFFTFKMPHPIDSFDKFAVDLAY
jgi:hypothetical protein